MEQIERIEAMEQAMDAAREAISALSGALDAYLAALPDIRVLERYYAGDEWKADFAADEAGALPPWLKRGVLSEDGLYDLLAEHDALRARLAAAAEGREDEETDEE